MRFELRVPMSSWILAGVLACVGLVSCGCQAYQLGAQSMYRYDIQTVHVAMFESDSYRRFLGQRLTEAVSRQVQQETPYQLASVGSADSFLRGKIVSETKRVRGEDRFDDPRAIEVGFLVEVTWTDRSGVPLMSRQVLRINRDVELVPEGGQSMTTAQQELINHLARQIVDQMEMPW